MTPLRIGVFGGAFDPPHRAHRALAEAALAQFDLDELRILPTGQAWHKRRSLTPASHRVAMTERAFADLPRVCVDPRETLRDGPSYTVDTLTELQAERPGQHWFLFMGEDQARAFTTWHRWSDIVRMATLVVARRLVDAASAPRTRSEPLPMTRSAASPEWHNPGQVEFLHLNMPTLAVSATAIRDALQRGETPADGLSPSVLDYIHQHQLYRRHHE